MKEEKTEMRILLKGEDKYPYISGEYGPGDLRTNRLLTSSNRITVQYKYPLSQPCEKVFESDAGWTEWSLLVAIQEGYRAIYDEEHAAVGDPGHGKMLLNRRESHGPHGIWGHDIGDLVLEGITLSLDGVRVELQVGS